VDALAKIPPALPEQLETSNAMFIAVDLEHSDNMQASIHEGALAVHPEILQQLVARFANPLSASGRVVHP
jgi:hypothetical protein